MTDKNLELAIVIPVYNEEGAIGKVISEWLTELQKLDINFQIHVYNDGSKDNTLEVLNRLKESSERLVVHDKKNSGHGPTILQGYRENIHAEWVFQVDSDDEMGPETFPNLWNQRKGKDFVIGKRVGRASPFVRDCVSRVSSITTRLLFGKGVQDVNSPYRLMRTEAFKPCFFAIPSNTVAPNIGVTGFAVLNKLKILILDAPYRPRVTGEVSIQSFKLLKVVLMSFAQTILYRLIQCRKQMKGKTLGFSSHIPLERGSVSVNGNSLYSWEECSEFDIENIWDLYRNYVNKGQVELISAFGFGRDTVKSAQGVWIETHSGKRILDFTGGIGVLNHGHNHPRILAARKKYIAENKMEVHKNFFSPYIAGLSHNIAQLMPENLNISYFCNSGAEAVEGALKMAYKFHGGERQSVLHSDIAFHGKTMGTASVTGSPELHFNFPRIPNSFSFEYNNIEDVKRLVKEKRKGAESDIFAVIVEPINGSSLRQCSKEFLEELRRICADEKIVLIFDEVYTGWAKCGELFAFMKFAVVPDIVAFAKSFGGGKASISGYTARDEIFSAAYGNLEDATLHSTTFNGFGEETVTAIEAINIIVEEDYVGKSKHIYSVLNSGLVELQKKYPEIIKEVRGAGSLNGFVPHSSMELLKKVAQAIPSSFTKSPQFVEKLAIGSIISHLYNEYNILTFYGSNREIALIISPSLVISDSEMELFLHSLDQTFNLGLPVLIAKFVEQKVFSELGSRFEGRVH